jgi:hypothetical protein
MRKKRLTRGLLAVACALACALAALVPSRALAADFNDTDWRENVANRVEVGGDDWGGDDEWLGGTKVPSFNLIGGAPLNYCGASFVYRYFLEPAAGVLTDASNDIFSQLGSVGSLNLDYTGTDASGQADMTFQTMYLRAAIVQQQVVSPVALGFLGLAMALSLLEFSKETATSRGGGIETMGSLVWIIVKFSIVMQLITHVTLLCGAIFNVFAWVARATSSLVSMSSIGQVFSGFMIQMQQLTYAQLGEAFLYLILALVIVIVVVVTLVRVIVVSVTRLIKVYLMSAFAGFPLVMITSRQTRDSGIRFFKSFAAVCLQSAVLLVLIASSGLVMAAATSLFNPTGLTGFANVVVSTIGPIAGCIAVQAMVGQSESLSNQILGA